MINIIVVMFSFLCVTAIFGIFLQMVNMKGTPKIMYDLYSHGKSCEGKLFSTLISAVLVPKRYINYLYHIKVSLSCVFIFSISWFFHFYLFSTIYTFIILIVIVWMILTKNQLPIFITMYISSLSAHSCINIGKRKQ